MTILRNRIIHRLGGPLGDTIPVVLQADESDPPTIPEVLQADESDPPTLPDVLWTEG